MMPSHVDGEPAELKFSKPAELTAGGPLKAISWLDFFSKFDQLGLEFIYDDEPTGFNEILQRDDCSPYRLPEHRSTRFLH